jgi:hypothetical protein
MLLAYSSPQHLPAQKVQQKGFTRTGNKMPCAEPQDFNFVMFQGTASLLSAGGSRMYVFSGNQFRSGN